MVVLSGGPASGGDFKSNSGAGGGFNFVFFEGLLKFCHAVNVSLSIHFLHSVEPDDMWEESAHMCVFRYAQFRSLCLWE